MTSARFFLNHQALTLLAGEKCQAPGQIGQHEKGVHAMRRFLIGSGGLLMLAGAAIWLLVPVRYEAFALLKISRKPPSVLEVHAVTDEDFAVFKRTQGQLVMSGLVLNGALREKEISNLQTIKEHNELNDVKVMMYSADTHPETMVEAKRLGAVDFLAKGSVSFDKLVSRICELAGEPLKKD